jgi:hypothetical protein
MKHSVYFPRGTHSHSLNWMQVDLYTCREPLKPSLSFALTETNKEKAEKQLLTVICPLGLSGSSQLTNI